MATVWQKFGKNLLVSQLAAWQAGSMAKLLRRTITITIVETWTLVWASENGPVERAQPGADRTDIILVDFARRHASIAQIVTFSSSHITTVLPARPPKVGPRAEEH